MKLAQTNLKPTTFVAGLMAAVLVVGSFGCGKSEAEKERHAARQKFKESVAALIVCTHGSTYEEFRKAEMDFRTSFELNKRYLSDVSGNIVALEPVMKATDDCFAYSTAYPKNAVTIEVWDSATFFVPNLKEKYKNAHANSDGNYSDPDLYPKTLARTGLARIDSQAVAIMDALEKNK